ncbi:ABC transporter ATP-binding protein [Pseudodesulfovibrio sp.]|uniref:ABC transporter ATP-binding protein n=1 Tax=unclassified Pseudodesulfovibrio TaxID=2661612 RepID=UPI003B00DBB3
MEDILLSVKDLQTHFFTDEGVIKAVDKVSFDVRKGKTLGVVGESGCGKSMTTLSILRLVDKPGRVVGGDITFKDKSILAMGDEELRTLRGNQISVIFQDPMTALNPVLTIGDQLSEVLITHHGMGKKKALDLVVDMLAKVGITEPAKRLDQYVHNLSGGIQQRCMIAMALLCKPELLIADEPTTALDVTIQAQILELLRDLQEELGTTIIFITHDLGVIAELADDVIVMYGGKVVESAEVHTFFKKPLHPYSWGLLRCLPSIDEEEEELYTIKGIVPSPLELTKGCKFNTRCPYAQERCMNELPPLAEVEPGHKVACHRWNENLFAQENNG